MGLNKFFLWFFLIPIFLAEIVDAHCPLCTVGAGTVALGAVWLGVSKVIVALLIGAFAMSMGMWFARIPKKQYIPFQKTLIIIVIFLTTVLPLLPIFSYFQGFYLNLIGDYGSWLNRTYIINYSLFSSFLGGAIVFISPGLNRKIKENIGLIKRNSKGIPFQGIILTFVLLIIVALIIQFTI